MLDVMLPDSDGIEVLKKIRRNPDIRRVPVIMVTAKSSEIDKVKGLDNGADDYITKPFGIMELISRVKALLRRMNQDEEEKQLTFQNIILDCEKRQVLLDGQLCELTYKEFELLKLFLQNAGIVMTRENIMEKCGGLILKGNPVHWICISRPFDRNWEMRENTLKLCGMWGIGSNEKENKYSICHHYYGGNYFYNDFVNDSVF